MDNRVQTVLERLRDLFDRVLGSNLDGIYLHGSLAFGCFTWETGDIDLIVTVHEEPAHEQKYRLISGIMDIEADAPPKGIEFSMLLKADCRNFSHPMPYVMHYSKAHRAAYRADMNGHIRRLRGLDPDLAAHITVLRAVGKALMGPPVGEVFAMPGKADYFDSIRYDIAHAADEITSEPVYVALNLCRALAWVQGGDVLSKAQGGAWGMEHLSGRHAKIAENALASYRTGAVFEGFESGELRAFAEYMLEQIGDGEDR